MLAFLGWNPGTDKEVFDLPGLISEFSLERVGKSGSKYDFSKTKWFNQQHLRLKSNLDIFESLVSLDNSILNAQSKEYMLKVIGLVKDRAVFESDILNEATCFLSDNIEYSEKAISKKWKTDLIKKLQDLLHFLMELEDFKKDQIEQTFHKYLESTGIGIGKIMPMLRIAITGKISGPSMFETMELLGRDKVKERIRQAMENIKI